MMLSSVSFLCYLQTERSTFLLLQISSLAHSSFARVDNHSESTDTTSTFNNCALTSQPGVVTTVPATCDDDVVHVRRM